MIKIWGSRGSLPSPAGHEIVRNKIFKALAEARGFSLNTAEDINKFIDNNLDFSIKGSYGSNTSCVEVSVTPGTRLTNSAVKNEYVIFDAGITDKITPDKKARKYE